METTASIVIPDTTTASTEVPETRATKTTKRTTFLQSPLSSSFALKETTTQPSTSMSVSNPTTLKHIRVTSPKIHIFLTSTTALINMASTTTSEQTKHVSKPTAIMATNKVTNIHKVESLQKGSGSKSRGKLHPDIFQKARTTAAASIDLTETARHMFEHNGKGKRQIHNMMLLCHLLHV